MIEKIPIALPLALVVATWLGWQVQQRLSERHRARETVDSIRLILSMLVTFAAIVLGLLTSSAKSHFDASEASLQSYGVDLIALDQRLREFGPDADIVRSVLREYTAAALADTWPEEAPPAGDYPRHPVSTGPGSVESVELGEMLLRVDRAIGRLVPHSPFEQSLLNVLASRMNQTLQQRWMVVGAAQPTTSWPFIIMMTLWLALVFVMFGLSSPPNPLVFASVLMTALSVSAAMWLLIELGSPLSGILKVSSEPLRQALEHMDWPVTPPIDPRTR
jgi:hypothetical protein